MTGIVEVGVTVVVVLDLVVVEDEVDDDVDVAAALTQETPEHVYPTP